MGAFLGVAGLLALIVAIALMALPNRPGGRKNTIKVGSRVITLDQNLTECIGEELAAERDLEFAKRFDGLAGVTMTWLEACQRLAPNLSNEEAGACLRLADSEADAEDMFTTARSMLVAVAEKARSNTEIARSLMPDYDPNNSKNTNAG